MFPVGGRCLQQFEQRSRARVQAYGDTAKGITPIVYELSRDVQRGNITVRRLIRRSRGQRTVLCSHGETIGPLIQHLANEEGVDFRGPMEWPKGSVWVLSTRGKRIIRARYVPPRCHRL